jgi:hypothetical protein
METEDDGYNPNYWHDILLKSIEDDADSGALLSAMTSVLGPAALLGRKPTSEKSNFIKLANPEKLASGYVLMGGDSLSITYKAETTVAYNYDFKVRTNPNKAGLIAIYKQKLDGKVYVEFAFGVIDSESRSYEMSEFTDLKNFMSKIVDVIINR